MAMTKTVIMAVPWDQQRVRSARDLHQATGGTVVWDQHHDAFETWQRVLAEAGRDPVIILEDDVVLAENWRNRIEAVIGLHRPNVIQFFSMRQADETVGSRWEPGRTFRMNQCYYLPFRAAEDLWAYSQTWRERRPEHPTGYDITMAEWMRQSSLRYWLSVPSLVQHQPWASAIGGRSRGRQSGTFQ